MKKIVRVFTAKGFVPKDETAEQTFEIVSESMDLEDFISHSCLYKTKKEAEDYEEGPLKKRTVKLTVEIS